MIRQVASNYDTKAEFRKDNGAAWVAAQRRGMLGDLFPKKNKDNIEESIIRILKKISISEL